MHTNLWVWGLIGIGLSIHLSSITEAEACSAASTVGEAMPSSPQQYPLSVDGYLLVGYTGFQGLKVRWQRILQGFYFPPEDVTVEAVSDWSGVAKIRPVAGLLPYARYNVLIEAPSTGSRLELSVQTSTLAAPKPLTALNARGRFGTVPRSVCNYSGHYLEFSARNPRQGHNQAYVLVNYQAGQVSAPLRGMVVPRGSSFSFSLPDVEMDAAHSCYIIAPLNQRGELLSLSEEDCITIQDSTLAPDRTDAGILDSGPFDSGNQTDNSSVASCTCARTIDNTKLSSLCLMAVLGLIWTRRPKHSSSLIASNG